MLPRRRRLPPYLLIFIIVIVTTACLAHSTLRKAQQQQQQQSPPIFSSVVLAIDSVQVSQVLLSECQVSTVERYNFILNFNYNSQATSTDPTSTSFVLPCIATQPSTLVNNVSIVATVANATTAADTAPMAVVSVDQLQLQKADIAKDSQTFVEPLAMVNFRVNIQQQQNGTTPQQQRKNHKQLQQQEQSFLVQQKIAQQVQQQQQQQRQFQIEISYLSQYTTKDVFAYNTAIAWSNRLPFHVYRSVDLELRPSTNFSSSIFSLIAATNITASSARGYYSNVNSNSNYNRQEPLFFFFFYCRSLSNLTKFFSIV